MAADFTPSIGALVRVRSVYGTWRKGPVTDMSGMVVVIIPANEIPDYVALAPLFDIGGAALKRVPVPTRASKYARLVIKTRARRHFVVPYNKSAYKFEYADPATVSPDLK